MVEFKACQHDNLSPCSRNLVWKADGLDTSMAINSKNKKSFKKNIQCPESRILKSKHNLPGICTSDVGIAMQLLVMDTEALPGNRLEKVLEYLV